MSVLLSMLTLVPGGMGGSETYARELVAELAGSDLHVTALVAPVARGFAAGLPERVAPEYPQAATERARAAALLVGLARTRALRRHLADAAVVHFPLTVPVPRPRRGQATVVTLHDVQHHDLPSMFSATERAYRSLAYDRAARTADAVVTISQFAKDRIVQHLGIAPASVHVAPLGVRARRVGTGSREPFLLYPARGWPHKNHVALFRALPALRASRPGLRLVLTGARPDELGPVPDGVEVRGQVSREQLDDLYGRASAVVVPSRYEGFGLPVLEAMSAGCPVAASTAGALPEVVGDAGVLFDPDDEGSLVAAVEEAWDRAGDLAARGLRRAGGYTWAACAQAHVDLYRTLGGT